MNERILKYLALALAFGNVASQVFAWLQFAQATTSEAGAKITPAEITQLQPVIQNALSQGLMAAGVPIMVEVKMTYIGG